MIYNNQDDMAVSPIVGVLLLLGLTIGLFVLATNVFFGSIDESVSPNTEIEISHEYDGSDTDAEVRIVRNENVDTFRYTVENEMGEVLESNEFEDSSSASSERIEDLEEGYTVVVIAEVGSEEFVIDTYRIPYQI